MKKFIGTCMFLVMLIIFFCKPDFSTSSESNLIQVKDLNSEASVREAMQGKWYTAQDQLASRDYYVNNGSDWERRIKIEGTKLTSWSRSNLTPEWEKIGTGTLKLINQNSNALSEINSNYRAIKWEFEVNYDNGSFDTFTIKFEKESGGVRYFRKGNYDIYRGWNH